MVELAGLEALGQELHVRKPGRPAVRVLLAAAGGLLVAVGTVGIFVPLLPSTVFYLLAAGCFGRSSPAAYHWLTTNRFFGSRLRDYREERGATITTKVVSLLSLWGGLAVADWFAGWDAWVSLVLLAVGAGVSIHILTLRTIPRRPR